MAAPHSAYISRLMQLKCNNFSCWSDEVWCNFTLACFYSNNCCIGSWPGSWWFCFACIWFPHWGGCERELFLTLDVCIYFKSYFMCWIVECKSSSVEEMTIHVQSMVLLLLWVVLANICMTCLKKRFVKWHESSLINVQVCDELCCKDVYRGCMNLLCIHSECWLCCSSQAIQCRFVSSILVSLGGTWIQEKMILCPGKDHYCRIMLLCSCIIG